MQNQYPLVTIITPAYNRAAFLAETIESVLSQDYPNLEYIVLDDGSKDNTREILEKYNGRIKWETHHNIGETRTVNKGFSMAKGEFICVINSDDPMLPNAIMASVQTLLENPDALAAYPDWDEIGPHSELIQHRKLQEYNIYNMLTDFYVLIGPGVFIRKTTINHFGLRDTQFSYVGDLEYWFRLASHGRLIHIAEPLATHRVHPDAASNTALGEKMANELVIMTEKTLNQPGIDSSITKLHNRSLSQAHYVAMYYCGNNQKARLLHLLKALAYNPFIFFGHFWAFLKRGWGFAKRKLNNKKKYV